MNEIIARNVAKFKHYLEEINFYMTEEYTEDGSIYFSTNEKTPNGAQIRLVAAFNSENSFVDVYCFNLSDVSDDSKKASILSLINQLNNNYRFSKFTMDDAGEVSIQAALDFSAVIDPQLIVKHIQMLYKVADEEYKSFMKLIWS